VIRLRLPKPILGCGCVNVDAHYREFDFLEGMQFRPGAGFSIMPACSREHSWRGLSNNEAQKKDQTQGLK
jgi:hypothetical protein